MREIVLDTETTGLDPAAGHKIVEIAGIELMHHLPTGRTYQCYLNPERDMPEVRPVLLPKKNPTRAATIPATAATVNASMLSSMLVNHHSSSSPPSY